MARILLLFPGQGSQSVGMGRYLWETYPAARDTYREAEDILGWDLRGLCLNGPLEELTRTDRAQVAIFVTSVAAWRVLKARGLAFQTAVGHSLGEYSALVATGQLEFADALRVVESRGRAMWTCGQRQAGTMAAIVGLSDQDVEAVCSEVGDAWPANYNCPGQVVVSGTLQGVETAGRLAMERGRGAYCLSRSRARFTAPSWQVRPRSWPGSSRRRRCAGRSWAGSSRPPRCGILNPTRSRRS
ncbi:MAG: ACP S-malonyltransferase [Thermoleophilia bacterium]|nr:ACP S-malonyltransferase [Thermoleophilia bacterium]